MDQRNKNTRSIRCATPLVLALCAVMLGGCAIATVNEPVTSQFAGNGADDQMSFWHELNSRSVTSNDDALHALLILIDGQDDAADYAGRLASLQSRNLLPGGFDRPGNEAVMRGTVAVVLVNALKIDGGLIMRTAGPFPRYAVRELMYVGIYPTSSPHQTFTGAEFVSVIGRAEDYQRRQDQQRPQAEPAPDAQG